MPNGLLPEASYQEIIHNSDIFLQKLHDFHSHYGTKFRIPTLGGKRLDLHQLFLVVTSRGGIEKVVGDRRWKEVTRAFNFPSTFTNASFVLRRYYLSLLYHFEQVYYFRDVEPYISSHDQGNRNACESTLAHASDGAAFNQLAASPKIKEGSFVSGIIDGKFDCGYLITINVGNESLKGVLYHTSVDRNASKNLRSPGNSFPFSWKKHQMAFQDPY